MDFLQPPEKLAETLEASGVKADYVFFFSYIQPRPPEGGGIWSAVDELVKVNSEYFNTRYDHHHILTVKPQQPS